MTKESGPKSRIQREGSFKPSQMDLQMGHLLMTDLAQTSCFQTVVQNNINLTQEELLQITPAIQKA